MAAAMRTARWRRWASSVPVIVALLFATTTVAATVGQQSPSASGHVPMVRIIGESAQQAAGQRPDVPVVERAGSWTSTSALGALAWLSARSGGGPTFWWHRRQDATGHRTQTRHESNQGRGPPGRRTATPS